MKKDIPKLKVEDVAIVVIPEKREKPEFWEVFIVNLKKQALNNVLINSTGYGEVNNEAVKTTTLRYFFEEIGEHTFEKVEILQSQLTELANEYWISFSQNGHMYDKKYIFVQGSLCEDNFTQIPIINKLGVMIR